MATATKERKATTIPKGDLKEALQAAMPAVPNRAPRPILQNVCLGDGLLTATDLEIRIDREIGYHGDVMLLPAKRLAAILEHATGDTVTLKPSGTAVTVKCGGGEWTLPTEDVAEYPTWDVTGAEPVCRLPPDQFCRTVKAVAYAVDAESSRYALGAVAIDVKDSVPTFVATDGRMLAAVEADVDQAVDDRTHSTDPQTKPPLLIPAHAIRLAATIAKGSDDSVQIEATASEVVMTCDRATITARLVSGTFPRWRDVFPAATTEPHSVVRDDLLASTRAAAVVTSEQSNGVVYDWGDKLTLTARSSEYGKSRVTCELQESGTPCKVKLNPAFVMDYLENLPADEDPHVSVLTNGPGGAVVLTTGDYRCVIMPLAEDA